MAFAEGYVDVAARIAAFRDKYPEGSLRPYEPSHPITVFELGEKTFLQYVACAYRSPTDLRPGIGIAWEPYPGKTSFTRDSEAMNAETSAWGRAIVAVLAADTHQGVASAEEVRNRQERDVSPLAAAKARAWTVAKRMRPSYTDDQLREWTEAELMAQGSSIADADVAAWGALADAWEAF